MKKFKPGEVYGKAVNVRVEDWESMKRQTLDGISDLFEWVEDNVPEELRSFCWLEIHSAASDFCNEYGVAMRYMVPRVPRK